MANYAEIRSLDISNGEGIGVSIFFSGCDFQCKNCFNKELWNYDYGKEFNDNTIDKIISLANKTYITRLSILGGDPLMEQNLDGVLNLVNKFRLSCPNKTIWLYTGFDFDFVRHSFEESKKMLQVSWKDSAIKRWDIISNCDILIDGRYIESQRNPSLHWRGSSNQRVIDVQESLKQNRIILFCD